MSAVNANLKHVFILPNDSIWPGRVSKRNWNMEKLRAIVQFSVSILPQFDQDFPFLKTLGPVLCFTQK